MRPRTIVAIVVVVALLSGATVLGLSLEVESGGALDEEWTSDTETGISGNHHAPAVGVVNGAPMVYAPISGQGDTDQCRLAGLHAGNGSTRWRYDVSPANCELHAVADPTLADFDGDGTTEVLAATTEETVTAHDPHTGEVEFRHALSTYGYTRPVVADLDDDGVREVVVVDVKGTVIVVGADGTERWRDSLDSYTWGQPAVRDVDGDGSLEVAVATESQTVRLYDADGEREWTRSDVGTGPITWMTTVDAADRAGSEIVVATTEGDVVTLDGTDGSTAWERQFESYAAVHAAGDGDGDGSRSVYAAAGDGSLWSLDAGTGDTEWTTTLTTEDVQMMPPPSLGDLDGDGDRELLAVANDGGVHVVDPGNGEVLATDGRDVPIFVHPTLADVGGDGATEAYVMFGDGRVVAYSYDGG